MQVRAPIALADAVKTAADRELTTISEYVRRALLEKLRGAGIDPAKIEAGGQVTRSGGFPPDSQDSRK